jgi:hypothetical protein
MTTSTNANGRARKFGTYRRPVLLAAGAGAGLVLASWLGVPWQTLVGWVAGLVTALLGQAKIALRQLLVVAPVLGR